MHDAKLELFVVFDANGDILWVTDSQEDAEHEAVNLIGTFHGPVEAPIPTRPVLKTFYVDLGPVISTQTAESLRRRVATRQRRQAAELAVLTATLKGGGN